MKAIKIKSASPCATTTKQIKEERIHSFLLLIMA
uniref:Uncharacterized protein n=1 Tax=Arundo donax TaxID=35708 RepID=A0A0A9GTV5_ARUDO